MVISKSYKDIKGVLLDPKSRSIKEPYYLIEDKEQVIFVLSAGQNGSEYNKTEGYFSSFPGVQTYQSLYGQGIMLMQRNDEGEEVKEFKVVSLSSGKIVTVPAGWAMCLCNTGSNLLVVLRNSVIEDKYLDSKPIFEKGGLAYFVVEKRGEIAFEQNPKYSVHPQITTE